MERRDFLKSGRRYGGSRGDAGSSGDREGANRDRDGLDVAARLPGFGHRRTALAASLAELSDGRMNVTYYAAGERVKPFDSFDEVASGNAQMYHAADYWKG